MCTPAKTEIQRATEKMGFMNARLKDPPGVHPHPWQSKVRTYLDEELPVVVVVFVGRRPPLHLQLDLALANGCGAVARPSSASSRLLGRLLLLHVHVALRARAHAEVDCPAAQYLPTANNKVEDTRSEPSAIMVVADTTFYHRRRCDVHVVCGARPKNKFWGKIKSAAKLYEGSRGSFLHARLVKLRGR